MKHTMKIFFAAAFVVLCLSIASLFSIPTKSMADSGSDEFLLKHRVFDKELGVVCYLYYGQAISCLKIDTAK